MSDPTAENQPQARSAAPAAAVSILVISAAFVLLATIGARQAEQQQRVLAAIEPLIGLIRDAGKWMMQESFKRGTELIQIVAGTVSIAVLAALVMRRLRAWPLLLLATSISLATWGQVELVRSHPWPGGLLYAAALLSALGFGIICPSPSLAQQTPLRRFTRLDALCMAALSVLGILFRLYALPELPSVFNGEMIVSMLSSRTFDGLRWYIPSGVLSNSTGLMHLLPQMLFYNLYGTTVYSLRLAAVLYGVLALPLFYWLVQRVGGTVAAVIATALLVSAPEQLYWSRLESTNFAPLPVLALISAHLGLAMIERVSFGRVAAAALWMPFGRYFYTAGAALVFYPWLQYAHAVLFVRRAWHKLWYVVPLLAAGTVLWAGAISAVLWLIQGGSFKINNPAQHGELILRGAGEYSGLGTLQLIYLQAESSWNNLQTIVQSLSYAGGLSEWYQRAIVVGGVTLMVPGVVVLIAVSLAYLLGQIQHPRAFAVLLWIAIGLLPAVLSMQPTDRRFLLIFPALYIAVGLSAQGFLEACAARGGKLATAIVAALVATAVAAVSIACLASHFLLRIQRTGVEELLEFSKPIFQDSDAIFFDTDSSWALVFGFGNADQFLRSPPCYRSVRVGEWMQIALDPPCDYQEATYKALLSPQRIDAARRSYDPQRFTFIVDMYTPSQAALGMLRGLFPHAVERGNSGRETPHFVALTFSRADIEALRTPELLVGPDVTGAEAVQTTLVANTSVKLGASTAIEGEAAVVRGGLYIKKTGWYELGVHPACDGATLVVDGRSVGAAGSATAMLAGVHPFELQLASLRACPAGLAIEARPAAAEDAPEAVTMLLAPRAAKATGAVAPALQIYQGYGAARLFAEVPGRVIIDFGVDDRGELILLAQGTGVLRGYRVSQTGAELASWPIEIPQHMPLWGIAVAANGTAYVVAGQTVYIYDRDGTPQGIWQGAPVYSAEMVQLANGLVLAAVPQESSIHVLNPDGSLKENWKMFKGGTGGFTYPLSVASDNAGTIAVLQAENEVLLFRTPVDSFQPQLIGSFHVDYFEPPNPRRVAFDGPHRLLFSDPAAGTPLVYNRDGVRMLAAAAQNDLSTRGFQAPLRMRTTNEYVYVLDAQRRLWQLPRLPE